MVKKYLSLDFKLESGNYGSTKESLVKPYVTEIRELLEKGYTLKKIEQSIRLKGYQGSSSTIRMHVTKERRMIQENAQETGYFPAKLIERSWLIKLLYKPLGDVSKLKQEYLDELYIKYPLLKKMYHAVSSFKELLKYGEEVLLING